MAQRRMFSLKIIDSDSFIDMPVSARCLYFDLSMRADDDGFVSSPKKIMKMTGAGEDDLKILMAKNYIIPFDSGVCVIKHWRIHNYIQRDRYQETIYKEEKRQLNTDENKAYIKCIQNVSNMDTQVRLGKVRLELGKGSSSESAATTNPFEIYKNNIGTITPHISEKITALIDSGIEEKLICRYIEVATERDKKNLAYIEAMAIGNLKDNISTLEQYEAYCNKRENDKSKQDINNKAIPQHVNFQQREYSDEEYEQFYSNGKGGEKC